MVIHCTLVQLSLGETAALNAEVEIFQEEACKETRKGLRRQSTGRVWVPAVAKAKPQNTLISFPDWCSILQLFRLGHHGGLSAHRQLRSGVTEKVDPSLDR